MTETKHADQQVVTAARAVTEYTIDIYRRLHRIPELRWQEKKTLALISDEIRALSMIAATNAIRAKEYSFEGGLVVDITPFSTDEEDVLLLRADIDALEFKNAKGKPLDEATGLPYASQHPGLMHACFHDCHAAMLLGFFRAVAEGLVKLKRRLCLVWQQAEENPITESGGAKLVRQGVMKCATEAYALHMDPRQPVGTFISFPGAMLGNSDRLKVIFQGPSPEIQSESVVQVEIKASGGHVARTGHGDINSLRVAQQIFNVVCGV